MKINKTFLLAGFIFVWLSFAVQISFGQNWSLAYAFTNLNGEHLNSMAMSADGKKLAIVVSGFFDMFLPPESTVYVSEDGGATWTARFFEPSSMAGPMVSSADGTKLAVLIYSYDFSSIYISTNSGVSWTTSGQQICSVQSLSSSADGARMFAVAPDGSASGTLWLSTDYGDLFDQVSNAIPLYAWTAIASSTDGRRLVACAYLDTIYFSTDFGATWQPTSAPVRQWNGVASSADGSKLAAITAWGQTNYEGIYRSADGGVSWVETGSPKALWLTVASSADGNTLIATPSQGQIFTSTNGGGTWTSSNLPNTNCVATAVSADGGTTAAIDIDGSVYTAHTTVQPRLNLCPGTTNVLLSWLVPSTDYRLEQSGDLSSWSAVTNPTNLNFTNLQNEVTLPVSDGTMFFRLKTL